MQLLRGAIERFKINPRLFLGIVVVPLIINVLVVIFAPSRETGVVNIYEWIVYGALVLALAVSNIMMGIALILAADNTSLTSGQAYKEAKSFFWKYLLFSLAVSLVVLLGFILLFVPGVILLVWFAFSVFVLILENAGIKESLSRSRDYVKGKWWGVFGRIVFGILVTMVVLLPFGILSALMPDSKPIIDTVGNLAAMLISPITLLYMYLLYQDVKSPAQPAV